jgi:hypothetical protein
MAGEQLRFDGRNLPAAACDSCWHLQSFLADFVEGTLVAIEHRGSAGVLLPAGDDHVGIFWVDLGQTRFAIAALAPNQRRPGASKQVEDDVANLSAVDERALDRFPGLGSWVQAVRRTGFFLPKVSTGIFAVPGVRLAGDVTVEQGLVLKLVAAEAPRECVLGPDNLAMYSETRGCQFASARVERTSTVPCSPNLTRENRL